MNSIITTILNTAIQSKPERDNLMRLAKKGDQQAKNKLIKMAIARYVRYNYYKYRNDIELDEFINECYIVINDLIRTYIYEHGDFLSYINLPLRRKIGFFILQRKGGVNITINLCNIKRKIKKLRDDDYTDEEIKTMLNIHDPEYWLGLLKRTYSGDKVITDDTNETFFDLTKSDINITNVVESQLLSDNIKLLLNELDDNTQQILHDYYWDGKPMTEITKDMSLSGETIRQKKEYGLKELRMSSNIDILKEFY